MTPTLITELACYYAKGTKTKRINAMLLCSAIKHVNDLRTLSVDDFEALVKSAGVHESYVTEIRKGIALSDYVILKPGV